MTIRPTFLLLLTAFFTAWASLAAPPAFAWGRTGHKVVCLLAYEALTKEARAKVDALIAHDPEFAVFADSCSWADSPRKRASEHYMNVDRRSRAGQIENCGANDKCIISAIEDDYRILADKTAPVERRLAALKFLGHWVGDIHQPLHVSFADDRGGNDIETRGLCRGTLHGAWDGCIIERASGDDAASIAASIRDEALNASKEDLGAPALWANESYRIARAPGAGYCVQIDAACAYSSTRSIYEKGATKRIEELDQAYIDRNSDVALSQLALAGARLGGLLNEALGE